MQLLVNGEPKSLSSPLSVTQLLDQLGLAGRRVAVEVNREIVPRSRHAQVQLKDDDHVEVVFAIGGG
jgi:sulfur carrier protein